VLAAAVVERCYPPKISAGAIARFMFLLNRQAENLCLPFPVHTTCILAHCALETQSKLSEHDRRCSLSMGQVNRPRPCLPAVQEGMARIDPLGSQGSIDRSIGPLSSCRKKVYSSSYEINQMTPVTFRGPRQGAYFCAIVFHAFAALVIPFDSFNGAAGFHLRPFVSTG
jgi:hypothetical protein